MLQVYHIAGFDVTVAIQVAFHFRQIPRFSLGKETISLRFESTFC